MRTKIYMAFLFCLTSSIANADSVLFQTNKPVVCSDLKSIVETLGESEIDEKPIFKGKDDRATYFLSLNKKTGSWTMVQFREDVACILGFGKDGKTYNLDEVLSKRRD